MWERQKPSQGQTPDYGEIAGSCRGSGASCVYTKKNFTGFDGIAASGFHCREKGPETGGRETS